MRVWTMPIVVTTLSAFGLVVGLAADGVADVLCWACLSVPVIATSRSVLRALRKAPGDALDQDHDH